MVYRSRLRGERPKAFWGALVGGAMNLIGSAISSKAQARAIQKQIEAQQEAARTQLELTNQSNLASTLNSYASATRSYSDEDKADLQYRLGGNKKLGSDRIVITDGGRAKKIAPNTFLLQGGSHEDTNESGNTGIGINVGGNEIEAEGGEVAQKKGNSLRIFSAQPMLGGISPAQAVLRGANKDKVFNAQQEIKEDNNIPTNGIKFKGGGWTAPVYNTKNYRVSNRMRKQIAAWEGSDFAGQNRKFKGDAIGAKERELRQMMGKTYNYLNDNQRDSLNSIYYNSRIDTFKNAFGKWFKNLNNAVAAGDERAFNNSLAGIRQSMTIGANRKGMSGLAKRRAWEQNWFGNPVPLDSQETKEALAREAANRMIIPADNTRVVYQPEYIEVPTPVGHGIVPVDNPDPNLLQGNIKENVINMGNKFRVNQRCGGSTRARLRCGGSIRPVKGSRMKLAFGNVVYPYRRNNNFDYWDEIAQEQNNNNDKGGIAPWQESNVYDVKVPNKITSSTPVIPYTPSQVVLNNNTDNTTNATIPYSGNKSGMILRDADWYGLGADLVSSIGGNLIGLGAYNKLNFDYSLPNFVEETPVALNTTYHNEAQKSNVERNRLNSRNSILRNTMSGSTAVGRMQGVDTNALYQLNQLADEKTNKETELMNQNLLNEQQVRARNAAAKNQYYATVANIKNAALQAKNEAELAKGQLLSGTLQGIGNSFQNLINQGRQNYDDTQAMLMGVAASDYATPSRLLELGVDVGDDSALAGIYRSAMNIPNPGAKPKREDYSDNTEYSYALTRWENQNKAYQRRNSYANLIKGRMSRKNQIKYGII